MNKSTKLSNAASLPQPTRQRSEIVACEPFAPLSVFAETGEYRRFVQVCEATRRYRYISVCVGASGVGKTKAAHRYAQWDVFGPLLSAQGMVIPPSFAADCPIPRTALYTVRPTATPKGIEQDLVLLQWGMQMIADAARTRSAEAQPRSAALRPGAVDLLLVDEVDRCSHISLEVLRDLFDRYPVGLVLLSRTDRVKHLLNQHPVKKRVGVLHEFCALDNSDARLFITEQVQSLGLSLEEQALKAFIEKTRGNFRDIYLVLAHLDYMAARHGPFTVTVNELEEAVARLMNEKNVQALLMRNR